MTDSIRKTSEYIQEPLIIEKSQRQAGYDASSQIFGAYLFNNKNLTFNPNINIQTPKNYEIGIGDQIIINIWGNS